MGPSAATDEASRKALASQRRTPFLINGIFAVRTFLFAPGCLSLYAVMKRVRREPVLIATVFAIIRSAVEFVQGSLNRSLIQLSDGYPAATSEAQRFVFVTAAETIRAAFRATDEVAGTLFNLAARVSGLGMLKGVFSKGVACLGLVGRVLGIVGTLVGLVFLAILLLAWLLLVGFKLHKPGQ